MTMPLQASTPPARAVATCHVRPLAAPAGGFVARVRAFAILESMATSDAELTSRGSIERRLARAPLLAVGACLVWLSLLASADASAKERAGDVAMKATPARREPVLAGKATPAKRVAVVATKAGTEQRAAGVVEKVPPAKRAGDIATKASPAQREQTRPPRGPSSWRAYAKLGWRRGFVTLYSPGIDRRWTGYMLGPGDTLLPRAEQQVRHLLASWRTGRSRDIDRRLVRLIARVSDVFGGRPVRVVSGFREKSHAKQSHHKKGEALDFSIDGVPNWALRDYLRTLDHTGVGYYPNSSFVHVDVRARGAYWVDLSRPGAPPRYVASTRRSERSRTD